MTIQLRLRLYLIIIIIIKEIVINAIKSCDIIIAIVFIEIIKIIINLVSALSRRSISL